SLWHTVHDAISHDPEERPDALAIARAIAAVREPLSLRVGAALLLLGACVLGLAALDRERADPACSVPPIVELTHDTRVSLAQHFAQKGAFGTSTWPTVE